MTTHYSSVFNPQKLEESAQAAVEKLIPLCEKENIIPVLIFAGLSGVSNAVMISHHLKREEVMHGMAYIRKDGEIKDCHGSAIEHNLFDNFKVRPNISRALIFVDDFVSAGQTRNRCIIKFIEFLSNYPYLRDDMIVHQNVYQLLEKDRMAGGQLNKVDFDLKQYFIKEIEKGLKID